MAAKGGGCADLLVVVMCVCVPIDTDEATLRYMEAHPEAYEHSNSSLVQRDMARALTDAVRDGSLQQVCADAAADGTQFWLFAAHGRRALTARPVDQARP
jgi:hypothetical protein